MNRRHHLQTLVSLGLTAPFGQCRILADTPKPDRVKFNTVDGVTLEGNFYPGSLGKKGDTFLFLHQLKTGFSSQDGWANLAVALQEKGHSVLTFDFRGHGESRSVAPEFWSLTDDPLTGMPGNPHNRVLNPTNLASRRATSINAATFPAKYFFTLVNDIAAAKMYLDERNDKGECNSSSLYVVAEGDACPLASLWMASEFSRKRVEIATSGPMLQVGNVFRNPRIIQNERITKTNPPEGNDLLAGIWLSYKPGILGQTVPSDRWLRETTLNRGKNRVQALFVYGAKDTEAKNNARRLLAGIRPGYDPEKTAREGDKAPPKTTKPATKTVSDQLYTLGMPVPDCNLAGSKMLRQEFSTQEGICDYVAKLDASRKSANEAIQRTNRTWAMIWQPNGTTLVPAKLENEQHIRALPIQLWGLPPL